MKRRRSVLIVALLLGILGVIAWVCRPPPLEMQMAFRGFHTTGSQRWIQLNVTNASSIALTINCLAEYKTNGVFETEDTYAAMTVFQPGQHGIVTLPLPAGAGTYRMAGRFEPVRSRFYRETIGRILPNARSRMCYSDEFHVHP